MAERTKGETKRTGAGPPPPARPAGPSASGGGGGWESPFSGASFGGAENGGPVGLLERPFFGKILLRGLATDAAFLRATESALGTALPLEPNTTAALGGPFGVGKGEKKKGGGGGGTSRVGRAGWTGRAGSESFCGWARRSGWFGRRRGRTFCRRWTAAWRGFIRRWRMFRTTTRFCGCPAIWRGRCWRTAALWIWTLRFSGRVRARRVVSARRRFCCIARTTRRPTMCRFGGAMRSICAAICPRSRPCARRRGVRTVRSGVRSGVRAKPAPERFSFSFPPGG